MQKKKKIYEQNSPNLFPAERKQEEQTELGSDFIIREKS